MPALTPETRLERLPPLSPSAIHLTPDEALTRAELGPPGSAELVTILNRPAYRFDGITVFADDGELLEVTPELAAEAAECAGAQGRFWQMHDLLFENQQHLQQDHLVGYAQELQLDMARFRAELGDHVYLQRVREHVASGNESGVRSTPAFFVDGRIQDVSFGMNELVAAVKARVG